MNKIISKTIKIISDTMPPKTVYIEEKIKSTGIEPLRWAIVEVNGNELVLNVSGYCCNIAKDTSAKASV